MLREIQLLWKCGIGDGWRMAEGRELNRVGTNHTG